MDHVRVLAVKPVVRQPISAQDPQAIGHRPVGGESQGKHIRGSRFDLGIVVETRSGAAQGPRCGQVGRQCFQTPGGPASRCDQVPVGATFGRPRNRVAFAPHAGKRWCKDPLRGGQSLGQLCDAFNNSGKTARALDGQINRYAATGHSSSQFCQSEDPARGGPHPDFLVIDFSVHRASN